nr:MAG TPA: hypothetical protein [Caudoviricetes sp.]
MYLYLVHMIFSLYSKSYILFLSTNNNRYYYVQ